MTNIILLLISLCCDSKYRRHCPGANESQVAR